MSLFIGIDSGTQSTKAIVLDLDLGEVIADSRWPHRMIEGLPPGHMEQHPADWLEAIDAVIREATARVDRRRVRGIGISAQQHGFVPLDEKGVVIRPAKLWNDTSTTRECELITKRMGGPKAAIRHTGNLILPGYTAPKILWLKRNEPANYRKLRRVLLPHDYINFYLTGSFATEHGDASGTALMDVRKREWSHEAIRAVDPNLADWLPPIVDSQDAVGTLRATLAQKYNLPTDVVISAGGGDNMMGAIGTGNVSPGVVTASVGTSGTIYAYSEKPVIDPTGEIGAFCSSTGGWLPLLCTMNATSVTEQIKALFNYEHSALDLAVARTPAGSGGLMLLPYFAGERTPNLPHGTGVLFGLSNQTKPAHIARAAMEGVTMGMNYGLRRLAKLGVRAKEIRVTGGGAKSPSWRQLMADIFEVPVVAMVEDEGAALGGAMQAAWCVARRDGNKKAKIADYTTSLVAMDESTRCVPNQENVEKYQKLQTLQDKLSASLREMFDLRSELM